MRILVSGGTVSVRRLAPLYPNHLGRLLTPANGNRTHSDLPFAVDNGAFKGFDPVAFRKLLRRVAGKPNLLWVAVPDKVGDARQTLWQFREWEEELQGLPLAFVGQDGAEFIKIPWEKFVCLFIGGTTEWKLSRDAHDLAQQARARGKMVHMGRCNSARRLRTAHAWGVNSVDGRQWSAWGDTHLRKGLSLCAGLDAQASEPMLFSSGERTTPACSGGN